MSIIGPQIFSVDFGALGTAAAPTHTYTGFECEAFEPTFTPISELREFADGTSDRPSSPAQTTWKIRVLRTLTADTTDGVASLEKLIYWFSCGGPWFIRGTTVEWYQRHPDVMGSHVWIAVAPIANQKLDRAENLYSFEFELRELATLSITAP